MARLVLFLLQPMKDLPMKPEFRVQDVLGSAQAIYLESVHMPGCFISFDEEGQPCEGTKLTSREKYSQLEILLVS